VRDQFFGSMYSIVEESAAAGGSARGTNFWVLYDKHGTEQDNDPYRVGFDDWTTMEKVRDHVSLPRTRYDTICCVTLHFIPNYFLSI
jgi:hypothetical protein